MLDWETMGIGLPEGAKLQEQCRGPERHVVAQAV